MKNLTLVYLMLSMILACKVQQQVVTPPLPPPLPAGHAKNIVFLIGDGMGLGQITSAMIANQYTLHLEEFKTIGLHKSYASNDLITDSAAGATAFSIGKKTFNGAIGIGADTLPYETILQLAESKGLSTGLVATSTIVHATPASFIAHDTSRANYEGIAKDFLETDIDFFVGGGKKFFDRRSDGLDLYQMFRNKGYQISDYVEGDLKEIKINSKKFAYLTADKDPLPVSQGRDYLNEASMKAIQHLSKNPNGFFLMIEGSQIDWGGHANETNYIVTELLEFDNVIHNVLKWAKADGNTLVVVTADHETGGMTINKGTTMDSLVVKYTSDYHTGTMIPVFAFGPKESLFRGIYENTSIYYKMKEALGWQTNDARRKTKEQ